MVVFPKILDATVTSHSIVSCANMVRLYYSSNYGICDSNSAYKLCRTISVAYLVVFVLLNKHQILGGGACLHCYLRDACQFHCAINIIFYHAGHNIYKS